MVMRKHHPSPGSSTYLNIMYVIGYIWPAAQACCPYIAYNGIMLNRSLGLLSAGLSLKRTAAAPRAPPGRRRRCGGFRRYRSLFATHPRPPYPCLGLRPRSSGAVRSPAAAVPHPYSCFRSVSVAPGRGYRRYRLFLPYRPAPPISALACPVLPAVPSVPVLPLPPARSVLSFGLLSAAVGRRGF